MKAINNKLNKPSLNKRNLSFTLAEVLIVLGIIGIIAEITIPTLMMNVQKQEYVVGMKKAYTETSQALKLLASDYGCTGDLKCTGLFATGLADPDNVFGDELVKYLRVAKNCRTDVNQGCWNTYTSANYDGTGAVANYDLNTRYKFITADGVSFLVRNYANDCINHSGGRTGDMTQTCAIVYIDLNGLKKPNFVGRDVFVFYITNGKGPILYPAGGADSNWSGTDYWWKTLSVCTDTNKAGGSCAARIMEEGWQMNY